MRNFLTIIFKFNFNFLITFNFIINFRFIIKGIQSSSAIIFVIEQIRLIITKVILMSKQLDNIQSMKV